MLASSGKVMDGSMSPKGRALGERQHAVAARLCAAHGSPRYMLHVHVRICIVPFDSGIILELYAMRQYSTLAIHRNWALGAIYLFISRPSL